MLRLGSENPTPTSTFEVLQRYDEFHYCQRARFSVEFDSKENFEKNYSASWFYYDR